MPGDARTPDLPWIADRPPARPARQLLALSAALALHGAIAAGLWFGVVADGDEIGGGGVGRDAIGIDIVDTKVLAALRSETAKAASASSIAEREGVARPEVASQETADAAAAVTPTPVKPVEQPDLVIPDFDEKPEPPTPATVTVARQDPDKEPPPTPPTAEPAKPDTPPSAVKVASLPAPEAVETALGGGVMQSAGAAVDYGPAAAEAAAGVAQAYGQDVMAALVTTLPRPRLGLATGTSGWLTGTVVIHFGVATDGSIARAVVATSSGHAVLDAAALDAVRQTRLPKPPSGMSDRQRLYIMPYYFR
jgi:periplasmic protein TonB